MATTLTFQPGRVPGIAASAALHEEVPPPMNAKQREALRALIHGPATISGAQWTRRSSGTDVVWVAVMALALLVGLGSLVEGVRSVQTVDAPTVAQPHTGEGSGVARLKPAVHNQG
jgi:hypothetical protein